MLDYVKSSVIPGGLKNEVRPVDREYDIFEVHPNGDLLWRECVFGLENARRKVAALGQHSKNQFFATHTPTQEIVARANHEPLNQGDA
jgi:hypothetical protein